MPVIVMLPGIAAYVLYKNGHLPHLVGGKDGAYSAILAFLPNGLKGLSIAALTAAIVASLAGKANSISTIYILDIHKRYFNKAADEKRMVALGRFTVIVAMLIAMIFTWEDTLGIGGKADLLSFKNIQGTSVRVCLQCLSWACSGNVLPVQQPLRV
jgi:SSS family solute:Na+ symporter